MGTLQHFVGNMPSESKRGKQRIEANRYKRWQTIKYVVLIAGLVAAAFGSMAIGWLDPFSLLVRSIGLSILPAFNFVVRAALAPLEHSHVAAIKATGETIHAVLAVFLLDFRQAHFAQGLVLGILFIVILFASLRVTRLWCRSICPLGALLGAVSRWSVLGLHKDPESCNNCNRCLLHCQGGDDPIGGAPWRKSECLMCMNCVGSCPEHALTFRFFRKSMQGSGLARSWPAQDADAGSRPGAVAVPLMRANTGMGKSRHERLLRPPGALDEPEFLSRCIRCGECMKVCPNNALHPTLTRPAWKDCGHPRWCRASATASRAACFALRCALPARSGRLRPGKRAGWWAWGQRASRSAWERRFMTAGAACPGPWPPNASFARSGARFRPKPSMSRRPRWWTRPETPRH